MRSMRSRPIASVILCTECAFYTQGIVSDDFL